MQSGTSVSISDMLASPKFAEYAMLRMLLLTRDLYV
jgi:hypothetical protein